MLKKILLAMSLILLGSGCATTVGDACNSDSDTIRTDAENFECLVQYRQAYDQLLIEVDSTLTYVETELNWDLEYLLGQPVNPN